MKYVVTDLIDTQFESEIVDSTETVYEGRYKNNWELYRKIKYPLGVVCVYRCIEDSWFIDCYVPRSTMLIWLQTAKHHQISIENLLSLLPMWFPIGYEYYIGPGYRFAHAPTYHRLSRDWFVFSQHGGRDV